MVVLHGREVGVGQALQNFRGLRALEGEKRRFVTHVLEGCVELVEMPRDVREILRGIRRVHDHHQLVFIAVDETVIFDRPAVVQDCRVVRLAHGERRDVVGGDVVHEVDRAGAAHDELSHVAHVEKPSILSDRVVLGGYARWVLHRHEIPGKRHELGAESGVCVG